MHKFYFNNNKNIRYESISKNKTIPAEYNIQKQRVDINKLLNRIRIDKKNEIKSKIIFYCSSIFALSCFYVLITILK